MEEEDEEKDEEEEDEGKEVEGKEEEEEDDDDPPSSSALFPGPGGKASSMGPNTHISCGDVAINSTPHRGASTSPSRTRTGCRGENTGGKHRVCVSADMEHVCPLIWCLEYVGVWRMYTHLLVRTIVFDDNVPVKTSVYSPPGGMQRAWTGSGGPTSI